MFMSTSLLSAFVLFAFVSSITPGPNNTMLLASGVNFGFRRSMPHALGISIGFMLLVISVGLGLGEVFKVFPWAYTVLRCWCCRCTRCCSPADCQTGEMVASRPMPMVNTKKPNRKSAILVIRPPEGRE